MPLGTERDPIVGIDFTGMNQLRSLSLGPLTKNLPISGLEFKSQITKLHLRFEDTCLLLPGNTIINKFIEEFCNLEGFFIFMFFPLDDLFFKIYLSLMEA